MRLRLFFASSFTALFVVGSASAAPTKEDVARADELFGEAQTLVGKGLFAEGCAKFAESQKLDPANGTLLNLALCHEKQGKFASAHKELQEVVTRLGGSKKHDDRERLKVAHDHLRRLEKKLSRVTFDVATLPSDVVIAVDGEKIDPTTPLPIDPGKHVANASAPKKVAQDTPFEITDPGPMTVKLDALVDDGPPPVVVAPPPTVTADTKPASNWRVTSRVTNTAPKGWSSQKVVGAIIGGVGIAGIGVGTFFGIQTFVQRSNRNDHCNAVVCDEAGLVYHQNAETAATVSTIAFAVGGAALLGGAILFFTAPKRAFQPTTAIAF